MTDKITEDQKVNKTFLQALSMIEKLEKVFESNSDFANAVRKVGGRVQYFEETRKNLRRITDDIKDAHYDALRHLNDDSYNIRMPLRKKEKPKKVENTWKEVKPAAVEQVVETPAPKPVVTGNEQSYSQLKAQAKEI
jgi:hypothetical protein